MKQNEQRLTDSYLRKKPRSPRLSVAVVCILLANWTSSFAAETSSFEYDELGRLVKVTRDDGTETEVVDLEYDAAGNRSNRTVGDGSGGGGNSPSNSPPNAVSDSVSGTRFSHTYATLTANDTDPDSDPLTITAVTQPSNGIVVIISATTVRIFGTSVGLSTFTYTISDGNGGTDTATNSLTVTGGGGGGGGPPL